jgi:hypothetical protein
MGNALRASLGALAVAISACGPLAPAGVRSDVDSEGVEQETSETGVLDQVTGGGQFEHPVFGIVTLSFVAIRHPDGQVSGQFQQHQPAFGFTYQGNVTCFAVDPLNHRAWIGGVLTQSNDPDLVTEVGDDAWFRVLDSGEANTAPDRSTFLGFEGGGGIITSEEYCQVRIWPEGNARTWPVVHGNIVIH